MPYTPRHSGPIHAIAWEGRSMFEKPNDPRIIMHEGPTDYPADLLMVYSARWEFAERARDSLPDSLRRRIIEGKTILVLDGSSEGGPFEASFAKTLHEFLRDLKLPAAHVAHMTQNRDFEAAYRAWCGEGVAPISIFNTDFYIRRFFQEHDTDGAEAYATRLAAFEARAAEREKRFVCLNFSPRPSKVLFLLRLIEGGLFDQGFISFPGFDRTVHNRAVKKKSMLHDLLNRHEFEAVAARLAPYLDDLEAKGACVLGPTRQSKSVAGHYKNLPSDMALEEYNRAWFTIITETEMQGTRRVTEKPFKALANFSPLLMLANTHSLPLLREFGFRTFNGVFNEAYDSEPDTVRRFEMVFAEAQRLCGLSDAQWRDLEAELADTLRFNAHHALVDMPRLYRQEIDPALVDKLLDLRTV